MKKYVANNLGGGANKISTYLIFTANAFIAVSNQFTTIEIIVLVLQNMPIVSDSKDVDGKISDDTIFDPIKKKEPKY